MTTHDNAAPPADWRPEPHTCPFCTIPAKFCGCPTGDRLHVEQLEAHIIRGSE